MCYVFVRLYFSKGKIKATINDRQLSRLHVDAQSSEKIEISKQFAIKHKNS